MPKKLSSKNRPYIVKNGVFRLSQRKITISPGSKDEVGLIWDDLAGADRKFRKKVKFWEAIMFAGHHKLENLMIIVDKNNFQALAETKEIINQENLSKSIESFGFEVLSVDGHDEQELDTAIENLFQSDTLKPKAIVANTKKGYGISFMEDSNEWHYKRLDDETYQAALKELELKK